jgi:putative ABC transport system permease protein
VAPGDRYLFDVRMPVRFADLMTLPVAALWQQKMRTILTTLGVVFGAFVLAASLSIGRGVQETIDRESHRSDISRRVEVFPRWNPEPAKAEPSDAKVEGAMSDARRERIRQLLAERKQATNPNRVRADLTRKRLDEIAALPHVKSLVPLVYNNGFAILGETSEGVQIVSARPDDESIRRRIVAGRPFVAANQRAVVISEFLAYRLGAVDDAQVEALIGKPLKLEFRHQDFRRAGLAVYLMGPREKVSRDETSALAKITAQLPKALDKLDLTKPELEALRKALKDGPDAPPKVFAEEYTIAGVARKPTEEDEKGPWDPLRVDSDVLMPYLTAMALYFHDPKDADYGVNQAVVTVDAEENVKDVAESIRKTGVDARAAIEFIERERFIYLMIFAAMTCVAAVALLVSALGIANTMLMSVLERTREIGIMKAVGADNRHLMVIFLIEGALIGLLGAGVGLLLAWAASYPGDAWVRSMVLRDLKMELHGSLFAFPPWMFATVSLFTVLVTTAAAVYPARHAARIDPVSALRHE